MLLVYGGGHAVRSGLIGRVKQSLSEAGVGVAELSGVMPNPADEIVYNLKSATNSDVDYILQFASPSDSCLPVDTHR